MSEQSIATRNDVRASESLFGVVPEQTVTIEDKDMPPHPESFRPRMFCGVCDGLCIRWYEVLKTGEAVPWKGDPAHANLGLRWEIYVNALKDVNFRR